MSKLLRRPSIHPSVTEGEESGVAKSERQLQRHPHIDADCHIHCARRRLYARGQEGLQARPSRSSALSLSISLSSLLLARFDESRVRTSHQTLFYVLVPVGPS